MKSFLFSHKFQNSDRERELAQRKETQNTFGIVDFIRRRQYKYLVAKCVHIHFIGTMPKRKFLFSHTSAMYTIQNERSLMCVNHIRYINNIIITIKKCVRQKIQASAFGDEKGVNNK